MLHTKAPLITRHDYEEMPAGPPYFQVIEGELVMTPSPNLFHQDISGNIFTILRGYLVKHPIGSAHIAPLDVYLSDVNVYQPDVIFVSSARRSLLTEHGIEGAPDLVVEILSPATARYDKGSKRKIYARTGVKELWLIDPDLKSIQVYELAKNAETPAATHGADSVFKSPLFPGLKIKTAAIFKASIRK
jgi:Uma2 family endonuclease